MTNPSPQINTISVGEYEGFKVISGYEVFTYEQYSLYAGGDLVDDALIRVGVMIAEFIQENLLTAIENPQFLIQVHGSQLVHDGEHNGLPSGDSSKPA